MLQTKGAGARGGQQVAHQARLAAERRHYEAGEAIDADADRGRAEPGGAERRLQGPRAPHRPNFAPRARALSPHSPACALATQVGCDLNNDNKITKVKPGSAAARAGILVGDTIIELEGAPLGDRRVKDVLVKKPKHSFTLLRPK